MRAPEDDLEHLFFTFVFAKAVSFILTLIKSHIEKYNNNKKKFPPK